MLTAKVDKKKIFQYSAILVAILGIMAYTILTNFVIKKKSSDTGASSTNSQLLIKDVKELNLDILTEDKFNDLKENLYIETKLEDLNVGKKDPFSPPASKVKNNTEQ